VKSHAEQAGRGRLRQQATDALLLMAALAHAEDDDDTAISLMLDMGICRQSELSAYSRHLGEQLGIADEYQRRQDSLRTSGTIVEQAERDSRRLDDELKRRHWA
jgi:hypothetical protein